MVSKKKSYLERYKQESQAPSSVKQLIDGVWVEVQYGDDEKVNTEKRLKRSKKMRRANKRRGKRTLKKYAVQNKSINAKGDFYDSKAWKKLRVSVLKKYGRKCMKCGDTDGVIQVDHIKPRSKWPELELVFDNMQVLCMPCNQEKSNKHCTDYRNYLKEG